MSATEDVSWATIRRIVREWAGTSADVREVRQLAGGAVSNTLGLTLCDGGRAVLKISPHRVDRSIARELAQLARLKRLGVPVPEVYAGRLASLDEPDSFLLMEFVEGMDLAAARKVCPAEPFDELQRELARVTLAMHSQRGETYGRADAEGEPIYADWPTFFRSLFDPMWRELEKHPSTSKSCRKVFNRLHEALPRVIAADAPRLTHGDLWCSNILVRERGNGGGEKGGWEVAAIIDPNLRFGSFEAELAYLEMFQTVTPAFLKEYKATLRPHDDYAKHRRAVYQAYYLMDHAAVFGGGYHAKFAAAAEKLSALV